MHKALKQKIELGDYQTPIPLAVKICETLSKLGVGPANYH